MKIQIRLIQKKDNKALAKIIRTVLEEQGNDVDGTVYTDKATDKMFDAYQAIGTRYYVVLIDDLLVGGCGIGLLDTRQSICELQRLFLLKNARGRGIGQELMDLCIDFAKKSKYHGVYLETFPNMIEALGLYAKNGFKLIDKSMGDTGHFYCTTRMLLEFH